MPEGSLGLPDKATNTVSCAVRVHTRAGQMLLSVAGQCPAPLPWHTRIFLPQKGSFQMSPGGRQTSAIGSPPIPPSGISRKQRMSNSLATLLQTHGLLQKPLQELQGQGLSKTPDPCKDGSLY
jgi:hypothetical protein